MAKITTFIAASCLAFAGATANAATVTNGSFEDFDGDLNGGGWNFFDTIDVAGWSGTPNIEIQTYKGVGSPANGTIGLDPIDNTVGSHYAELDTNTNSVLSQTINFAEAGRYVLSFLYSPRVDNPDTDTNDMSFKIEGQGDTVLEETILGAPNGDYPHGEWTRADSFFTIESLGDYVLSFAALGGSLFNGCGNCGALIDDVSIAAVIGENPQPVPLPASSLLLLAGLGGLGAMRRMKRS
ncbi:VPLPA-CTERM protein sorting domain-containing protein [Cognatiyoonia sediminum]|uniref:VPLPA-CTERM protein sorting domain-containing protein n=1 Tax=Cognatiyoonia sediminum TaxID=1508389 RepID=A0A1M5QTK9_9RHOB|nr:VPLPA-CTERM sorting domain-containing protein [Cognatiyoonia sediminum]SHH17487.1 VPLPA-CTERM protein sorting domain-containing protein [Cognatiyoonia sediminum]